MPFATLFHRDRPAPRPAAALCLGLGLLSALPSVAAPPATAWQPQRHPRLHTARAAGPIAVDGLLDDAGWRGLPRAQHFVEHNPGDQVQPPVPTEALLTYDDDYLYAAFICYDDPAGVRASFTERDRIWNDDYVILALDTFGDQAWAFEIASNPYGIQGDLLWSAGYGEDMSYDLVFHSAGRITDDGWQVEMAIPWTSLRFPDRPEQEWRVDFWRNRHRDERGQYSWGIYDRDDDCWPCQWGTVTGITGVSPGTGLKVLPAFVAKEYSHRRGGGEDAAGEWVPGKAQGEPSLSVSYGLTPTVVAEATLNPDFSQVESDAGQIDVNSAFALNYPEKRPFFQEGSDLWTSNYNLIYTRSVNDPAYAGKLTGRPGRTNFAVLAAQDETTPFILPFGEYSEGVGGGRSWSFLSRVKHTLGEQSHVGLTSTARWHEGGGYGAVESADARLRLTRNLRLELQAVVSTVEEPDSPELTAQMRAPGATFDGGRHTAALDGEYFTGHGLYASLERTGRSFGLDIDYWERSPTFRAENGFEPRNDQRQGSISPSYTFWMDSDVFERVDVSGMAARMWNFDGLRKDEWAFANVSTRLRKAQAYVGVNHMRSNELYQDVQFDGIFQTSLNFQLRPSELLFLGGSVSHGHRIARRQVVMGSETGWNAWYDLKPWSNVLFEHSVNHVRSDALDDGRRLFDGYIQRFRLNMQLTREWSLRVVVQYDDFGRVWDADPLVTWRLNPFSIFYVGSTRRYADFTGSGYLDDDWRLSERTYFLKLQYLWQL